MESDVVLNKIHIIERCLNRIHEEYANNPENLVNFTKQDSIILNLQRACEASIDLAMHVVAEKNSVFHKRHVMHFFYWKQKELSLYRFLKGCNEWLGSEISPFMITKKSI